MKKVYLIHCWDGNPVSCWYPWLKKKLTEKGFQVIIPAMPEPAVPKIDAWVGYLKKTVKPDKETYFVGHSIGCQTIMRFLESAGAKVGGVVFVAPWLHLDEKTIEEEGEEVKAIAKPWIETPIDFDKVNKCCKFSAIFSDNDPFVPLSDAALFRKKLGAKTTILHAKGHFDDATGVKELPEVFDELMEMIQYAA